MYSSKKQAIARPILHILLYIMFSVPGQFGKFYKKTVKIYAISPGFRDFTRESPGSGGAFPRRLCDYLTKVTGPSGSKSALHGKLPAMQPTKNRHGAQNAMAILVIMFYFGALYLESKAQGEWMRSAQQGEVGEDNGQRIGHG